MQSTFWKAVALTGVISVGCFVVYEVHRRMPKQQGETAPSAEFKELGDQQSGGEIGVAGSPAPLDQDLPPAQQEPESDHAFAGAVGNDPASAAPWERVPQRTDEQTTARAGSFLDVMNSSDNSSAGGVGARQLPTDASANWTDNNLAAAGGETASSLPGSEGSPFAAGSQNEPVGAGNQPTSDRSVDLSATGVTPADFDNAPGELPESVFGAGGVVDRESPLRTRDVRPLGADEGPADSTTADPFAGGAPLEPADSSTGAALNESDPTGLFGSPLNGQALDGNGPRDARAARSRPDGVATDAADSRLPGTGAPGPLPSLTAAPLDDANGPTDTSNSTTDPFASNETPLPPPDGNTEPSAAASADSPSGTEDVKPEGNGLSAPREFLPFDTAQPARGTEGASGSAAGVVLSSDAPAEFPVGAARAQPDALPAAEDTAPFTIKPARERKPDPAAAAPPATLPHRDFSGDGIIGAESPSGPQQPELKIEKVAPPEATVGDPLVYAIRVTNVGRSAAHDVIVEDRIPRGTTLDGTIPRAEMTDKKLLWRLGTIEPGGEQMIRIRVVPTEAGEIGSVATVRFVAEVAAATVITRPELSLEMSAPGEVAVGEQATFHFKVVNSGAADARDVIIRSLLPKGLEHPDGNDIEYPLGRLRAGEAREIELTVLAKEAGQLRSQGLVAIGSKTYAEQESPVLVIPSRLIIRREGPARRFVGRKADYATTVTNRSNRDLQQVTVEEQLPPGLELAAMPQDGQFDSRRRTITWKLPLIRAGESISLKTSVVAQSPGTLESIVRASDAGGNKAALASRLEVAGFSALAVDFEHAGNPGPVSVGEQVSFRLTVKNRGTAPAEGVQALFEIPEHMEFVHADGPVAYTQEGQVIRFSTLNEIAAKDETSFNIVLTAAEAGTKKVTAELSTPTLSEPLRNDQAVVVEADE